jgi:hypothetical protein
MGSLIAAAVPRGKHRAVAAPNAQGNRLQLAGRASQQGNDPSPRINVDASPEVLSGASADLREAVGDAAMCGPRTSPELQLRGGGRSVHSAASRWGFP